MPYQLLWMVPDRVLYDSQWGDVTPDEVHDLTTHIADLLDEAYKKNLGVVVAIMDMREANMAHLVQSHSPTGIRRITDAIDPRIWKVRQGFTILITNRKHIQIIISIITKLFAQPLTTVGNFDEAVMVAKTMYPELREQLDPWEGADPFVGEQTRITDQIE